MRLGIYLNNNRAVVEGIFDHIGWTLRIFSIEVTITLRDTLNWYEIEIERTHTGRAFYAMGVKLSVDRYTNGDGERH